MSRKFTFLYTFRENKIKTDGMSVESIQLLIEIENLIKIWKK